MELELWMWAAFGLFVVAMLLVDLVAFGRRGEEVSFRRAVAWSIGWTLLGVGFAGFLWAWQGRAPAEEYLAGFLIEKSLSIDNLFVFALIFGYFAVPAAYQRRVHLLGHRGRDRAPGALHPRRRRAPRRLPLHDLPLRRVPRRHGGPHGAPPLRRDPSGAKPGAVAASAGAADEHAPTRGQPDRARRRPVGRDAASRRARARGDVRRRLRRRLDPGHLRDHARHLHRLRGQRVLAARPGERSTSSSPG